MSKILSERTLIITYNIPSMVNGKAPSPEETGISAAFIILPIP